MPGQDNIILLRINLDEGATKQKLEQVVLDIEATKKAQTDLATAKRAGSLTEAEYARQVVALRAQLKGQQQEQTALTRTLEQFQAATTSAEGSVDALKAQSALLTTQYNALSEAERKGTAAGRELGAQLKRVNDTLKAAGANVGDFRRNVGAYPGLFERVGTTAGVAVGRLDELDKTTGAFGGTVGGLRGKFNEAKAGIEAAKLGFGGLKGAIAATGVGVFLLALGVLYTYLTRTQEGLDFVERKTKGFTTVLGVLTDKVSVVGGLLFDAFDHPLESLGQLVDFIEQNLLNRLTSVKVILDGLASFDGRKIADGFIQAGTGITDATSKGQNLVAELDKAAQAGEAIAAENQRIRDTERAINVERAQSKKDVEALKLIAEDVTKSTTERAAATQKAADIEQRSINKQLQVQRDKVANIEREAKLTNQLTENNEKLAEEKTKLAELEEGSLTRQIELNNKLNELRQLGLDKALADQKAYYERQAVQAEKGSQAELNAKVKALEADRQAQLAAQGLTENQRRLIVASSEQAIKQLRLEFAATTLQQATALQQLELDRRIQLTQAGSDEELSLQRQKLEAQRGLELSAANLTVGQRKIIEAKFLADMEKLEKDSAKQRALAAYEAELASVNAELALVQRGTSEETELRVEAINTQLAKELAALDKRQDNTARAAQLRANAEKSINDTRYAAAQRDLEQHLTQQRLAVEDANSRGLLSEKEYNRAVLAADSIAASSRLELARDFKQETVALANEAKKAQIAIQKEITDADKTILETRKSAARQFGEDVGHLIADSLFEQGASIQEFLGKILILALDVVEKQLIAQQIASIGSASVQSMSEPDSVATFGATGFARIAILTAAITAAFEIAKAGISAVTTPQKQFAQGGIVYGPSHSEGGIPLYHQGRPAGIEIEGREVILTKRVTDNPLLLSLASFVNQAAGGRALTANLPQYNFAALGAITRPVAQAALRNGATEPINYERLAQAMSKLNIYTKTQEIMQSMDNVTYTKQVVAKD